MSKPQKSKFEEIGEVDLEKRLQKMTVTVNNGKDVGSYNSV